MVLGIAVTKEVGVSMGASVEVRDASGQVVQQPEPPRPVWTPALRFFRLSQAGEDLYEAYRNAFLALEAILSARFAAGPPGERAWLEWAMRQLVGEIDLARYVARQQGDLVESFVDEQYEALRCATFHAKAHRKTLLPGTLQERDQVAGALERLTRLVIDIGQAVTNMRYRSSAMTTVGFEALFIAPRVGSLQIWLETYDETGAVEQETPLAVGYMGKLDDAGLEHGFVGECPVEQLGGLPFDSVHVVGPGPGGLAGPPIDTHLSTRRIEPAGADIVRVQLCFALNNLGLPRSRFTL